MPDKLPATDALEKTSKEMRRAAAELMKDAKRIIDRSRELRKQAEALEEQVAAHRRTLQNFKAK